jgi:plastocyanin
VKRASVAVLAALLVGAALVAPSGAATTTCVWVKHTKRVVSHVKRHGKRVRVVHLKHYRTCRKVAVPVAEPAPGATATPPAPAPAPAPGPTEPPATNPTPEPEPEANAVSVTAGEDPYSYVTSRSTVHTGRLTVQLINAGADPHDMDIQQIGEGGPEGEVVELPTTASKTQSTKTVELPPGRYRMWCTLFHHAEEGMEATLTVE